MPKQHEIYRCENPDSERDCVCVVPSITPAPLLPRQEDSDYAAAQLANARLIAAAPEMLERFQRIAELSAGWDEDGSLGPTPPYSWETVARLAMDYARAAIAKAEGTP